MSSTQSVASWYANKNVFITGGSGFLGLCLLEKLLRCVPNIGDIYLLLRPKKGKSVDARLEDLKKNSVFETLLQSKSVEQCFSRVKAIAGDIAEDGLGISASDRQILVGNVNVIFHSAATLDFAEGFKQTVQINLLGTRQVLALAKECRNFAAFVHVSSAYVNSFQTESEEIFYPLKGDPEDIIAVVEKSSEKELEERSVELLNGHANTYTYTKQMAEKEVEKMEKVFPCAIVRPSMIVGAWKEPVPGWTASKNGPQGFLMGASKGIIRRLPVSKELIYDYIPVDVVVNQLIVAAFRAGSTSSKKLEIFHCTSSTRKPFTWSSVYGQINSYLHTYPLKSAVWYPHLKLLPSVTWFRISALFVHFLPAIILDGLTKLAGGRPILMRLHRRQHAKLQEWLTSEDQVMFNLDLSSLRWPEFFGDLARGVRVYLNHEKMSNIEAARGKDTMLMVLHLALQLAIYSLLWYTFACLTGLSMSKSMLVVPVFYVLFSFV
ncbi:hypothetical protein PPYR_03336 [Photinus pyralis]|uniref:Fatty acyl-CoA reductase n=1 Tax=Photinus pyralis TaxID=7054 RepID=A0A5N4A2L0_PHOPY|nr:hypothetical protein PPYR_03336 [Photinus pyralis]